MSEAPNFRQQEIKECIICKHFDMAYTPVNDGDERLLPYCKKHEDTRLTDNHNYSVCDDYEG